MRFSYRDLTADVLPGGGAVWAESNSPNCGDKPEVPPPCPSNSPPPPPPPKPACMVQSPPPGGGRRWSALDLDQLRGELRRNLS